MRKIKLDRIQAIDEDLRTLACGDGGCCIRKPKGMQTNGGCGCLGEKRDWDIHQRSIVRRALSLRQEQVRLLMELVYR